MKKEIKKVEEPKKEVKKENKKKRVNKKKVLFAIKLALYGTMLAMIYVISPRLTEWLKIGLQAIIDIPSENITRVITIILAVILSVFTLRNKKKGE